MSARSTARKRIVLWLLALVLLALPAAAEPPEAPDKPKDKTPAKADKDAASPDGRTAARRQDDEEVIVFTNEELDRRFPSREGTRPAQAPGPATQKPGDGTPAAADPLAWLEQQQRLRRERGAEMDQAEQAVALARQAVLDLEKRVRAIRNPLLARPAAPADGEAESGTATERLAAAEDELARAREALAQTEQTLDELRRAPAPGPAVP